MMKVPCIFVFPCVGKVVFLVVCDGILVDCRINQLNIGGVFWVPWGSKPNAPKRDRFVSSLNMCRQPALCVLWIEVFLNIWCFLVRSLSFLSNTWYQWRGISSQFNFKLFATRIPSLFTLAGIWNKKDNTHTLPHSNLGIVNVRTCKNAIGAFPQELLERLGSSVQVGDRDGICLLKLVAPGPKGFLLYASNTLHHLGWLKSWWNRGYSRIFC